MTETLTISLETRERTKGMRLINSFVLANLCDAILTGIALNMPGFSEKGLLAADMLAHAQVIELVIFKISITAFIIGIYALTAQHKSRWSRPIELSLKIGIVLVWCVVAWNELNIILALRAML